MFDVRSRLRWCSGSVKTASPSGTFCFQPISQLGGGAAIGGDERGERGFRLGEIVGRPDRFQLAPNTLADLGIRRVMDGVPGQVVRRIRKQRGALFS